MSSAPQKQQKTPSEGQPNAPAKPKTKRTPEQYRMSFKTGTEAALASLNRAASRLERAMKNKHATQAQREAVQKRVDVYTKRLSAALVANPTTDADTIPEA